MTVDIEKLEALAKAAPEGPWFGPEYAPGTSHVFDVDLGTLLHYESISTEQDACLRYVAAANPAAVLELIQTIRDLQSSAQGLKTGYEAYERVNAELRAECERLRKDASLHANLQRAAGELPGAWSIDVSVERHAGWVSLLDGDGCEHELSGGGHLGEQVSEALEVALEISKEQGHD
ncbi:hypothetical protein V2J79_05270 [Pseudomonas alliivorans]|nr:hypothetical protein [Pseudomonas alliivorans]